MIGFFLEKGHGPSHTVLTKHKDCIMSLVINGQPASTGCGGGRAGALSWEPWPRCRRGEPGPAGAGTAPRSRRRRPAASAAAPPHRRRRAGSPRPRRSMARGGRSPHVNIAQSRRLPWGSVGHTAPGRSLPRTDAADALPRATKAAQRRAGFAPFPGTGALLHSARPFPSLSPSSAPGSVHGAREPPVKPLGFGGDGRGQEHQLQPCHGAATFAAPPAACPHGHPLAPRRRPVRFLPLPPRTGASTPVRGTTPASLRRSPARAVAAGPAAAQGRHLAAGSAARAGGGKMAPAAAPAERGSGAHGNGP